MKRNSPEDIWTTYLKGVRTPDAGAAPPADRPIPEEVLGAVRELILDRPGFLEDLLLHHTSAEQNALLDAVWRAVCGRETLLGALPVGFRIAFWYETHGRTENARRVWSDLAEAERRERHHDLNGWNEIMRAVLGHAHSFWTEGRWRACHDRFARAEAIMERLGLQMEGPPSAPIFPTRRPPVPGATPSAPTMLDEVLDHLVALADSFYETGDRTGARNLYEYATAFAVMEQFAGPDHPCTAVCLNMVLRTLQDHGDYRAVVPLGRRVLEVRERALGPDHFQVAESLNNLAAGLVPLGMLDEALPVLLRSIQICPAFPNPYYWLAKLYQQRHRPDDRKQEAAAWRRYLELGPTFPGRAEEGRKRLDDLSKET